MRGWKEREAAEDSRPPVLLNAEQLGLVLSAFTVAARLGVVNGDPDVAADLCEVITGISMRLREEGVPVEVPALLISKGLLWARLPLDELSEGRWCTLPGKTERETDEQLAATLRADLEVIEQLLG